MRTRKYACIHRCEFFFFLFIFLHIHTVPDIRFLSTRVLIHSHIVHAYTLCYTLPCSDSDPLSRPRRMWPRYNFGILPNPPSTLRFELTLRRLLKDQYCFCDRPFCWAELSAEGGLKLIALCQAFRSLTKRPEYSGRN